MVIGIGTHLRPTPLPDDRRLEAAEGRHPPEAGEVAVMGQLVVTRRADQPAKLRPVEAAVIEVVELSTRSWLGPPG